MLETPPVPSPKTLPAPGPRTTSRTSRFAAWIATLLWLVVVAGLFFHHSAEPVLLGRFSKAYALGLLGCVLVTPIFFLATRSVFSPSLVTRPDGTTLVVSPLSKVLVIGLSALLVFGLAQLVLPKRPRWEYLPHAFLQAVPAPDSAKGVNSRGFRGGEPAVPKPPGVFRIVLLGGSTTFDPDLEYEATYGRQLELLLGRTLSPRRVDVQCAAVPAYNSVHSLIRYATDAIDLDSDVVLVMHAVNDLFAASRSVGIVRRDYGHMESLADRFLHPGFRDRTYLVDIVRFFWRFVAFSDLGRPTYFHADDVKPDPGPMVRNLRSIVVLGRSRGQTVVLCTQPNRYRMDMPLADRLRGEAALRNFLNGEPLPGFVWYSRYMAIFNENVRALAAEEGVPLLDLQRDVPPTDAMFLDDVHVTPAGARLEAKLAAAFLVDMGLTR